MARSIKSVPIKGNQKPGKKTTFPVKARSTRGSIGRRKAR